MAGQSYTFILLESASFVLKKNKKHCLLQYFFVHLRMQCAKSTFLQQQTKTNYCL